MNVDIKQAIKLFFTKPSLELVYFEAISNSLDADATKIEIDIAVEEFSKPETLKLSITDNGVGFTDERFAKFKELLKVEEESHKGIGRLVFLSYFKNVYVDSKYNKQHRTFEFTDKFKGKSDVNEISRNEIKTKISFSKYYKKKIKSHDFLLPTIIANRIKEEFYPRLYLLKKEGKDVVISIKLKVNKPDQIFTQTELKGEIRASDLPELNVEALDIGMAEMFREANLHYAIIKKENVKTIVTAICVDGRSYKQNIISDENIPLGHELIFLLYSDVFKGKVDPARQNLTIKENVLKPVITLMRSKISEIISKEIPEIVSRNHETKEDLTNKYPHLLDYIEVSTIGFIKREDTIKKAQEKFFKDQKEILEAPDTLDEETYQKTLELSSRLLTEYILYRQIIINRLKQINETNIEDDIHNLIVPMRRKFHKDDFINDIFSNNAWLLDDKFMTYNTILSDKVMSQVIKEITKEESPKKDNTEPDIAIIFSNNPENDNKVDVVIVELKKKGASLDENVAAITQLQTRARKLMKLYPNKIQRIWFYALVDLDEPFQLHLESNKFIPLFSTDTVFYREDEIKMELTSTQLVPIGIFILSFKAFVEDANIRNSTFLNLLKENFRKKTEAVKVDEETAEE